ncbi:MAG: pyridoxal-phosphate dependent enzyme [Gammaproteobacteria bacterium]|nr:pyridoxal-phosphate dependent enzyme [Gammaproteobacteria bacterium]MDH3576443.1 pyridoxal-phosphate dependent enzyme [Gammaproteobacteria bacterium]
MTDSLAVAYPLLADRLRKVVIADLPTPVSTVRFDTPEGPRTVSIKHDDVSSAHYGGNKIRKLEYIFQRAKERGAQRVATFGAVGSNHALATAIFSVRLGFECTCILADQKKTPTIPKILNMHRRIGTEIVRYPGNADRLATFRRYLQGRRSWVVPLGGSCWLGAVGFVNAGLELAAQVAAGEVAAPHRVYIANGTMGSAAGLSLGLALAGLPTEVHAVRVVDRHITNPESFERLLRKTALLLNRLDPSIEARAVDRTQLRWRDEFFAGGYAASDRVTANAVSVANDRLGLALETTYTGKAMAALLHDLAGQDYAGENYLFWNTYNSQPLPVTSDRPCSADNIPEEFMTYFD